LVKGGTQTNLVLSINDLCFWPLAEPISAEILVSHASADD